jgi:hypothetical protein
MAFAPILQDMFSPMRTDYPQVQKFLDDTCGNASAAVILLAMIYLYLSLGRHRQQRQAKTR